MTEELNKIREEIWNMLVGKITGKAVDSVVEAKRLRYLWDCFIQQIKMSLNYARREE